MVLGTAEGLHALARGVAALEDVAGDRRGPDEGDGGDLRVVEERVDGFGVDLFALQFHKAKTARPGFLFTGSPFPLENAADAFGGEGLCVMVAFIGVALLYEDETTVDFRFAV